MAMVRAAMVNSARMWPRIAQPTILRLKSHPSAVGT
jgi:hypothetical protein